MSDPDQRLMRRLQKGDDSAFEVLLHKFQAPVLSLVRRYLGSRSPGIDDVAQEVFLRIYRSSHTYEPKAKVGTWIYRITVNTCLNEIRRLRAEKNRRLVGFSALFGDGAGSGESGDGDAAGGSFADPAALAPPERLAAGEVAARVRAAIDRLPARQRSVIVLRDVGGFSADEVCATLEVSEANQRVLLHRARAKVRDELERYLT
jgi:RNA polymerase sigma-70 factor (ECF subfamily)